MRFSAAHLYGRGFSCLAMTPAPSRTKNPWQLYQELEDTFYRYQFFDASNSLQTDAFSFSVYSYAQKQNTASPITPDLVKNCTEDLFRLYMPAWLQGFFSKTLPYLGLRLVDFPSRLGDWDRVRPKVPFMRKILCHDATAATSRG